MEFHRVRRLAEVLVVSQLRSGRSTSDPASRLGRPGIVLLADALAFLVPFVLVELVVSSASLDATALADLANRLLPFVPLAATSFVLIAGVMLELTTTAKFSGSDAANWMPLPPREYVVASATAIAYAYAPGLAVLLGLLLPISVASGTGPTFVLTAGLAVVGLGEGAFLVEMIRAVGQRAGAVTFGRRAGLTLVLRAGILVVVILAIQLLVNPIFLFAALGGLASVAYVSALVPFLWSTQAVALWAGGNAIGGLLFASGQVAFVALLAYLAAQLRVRYWVPAPAELRLEAHRYAAGHRTLAALGLTPAEAALVAKDLHGLARRRELLPMLVLPFVLAIVVVIEGMSIGGEGGLLWAGWIAGFFALLLSTTAIGQERRALQGLYALPITATNLLRAKATSVLIPSLATAAGLTLLAGLTTRLSLLAILGEGLLAAGGAVVLTLWGLAFAARFSDFQERPRPQYLRPAAMLAATGSGMLVVFAIVLPGSFALANPSGGATVLLAVCLGAFSVSVVLAYRWVRTGFDRLLRELPF